MYNVYLKSIKENFYHSADFSYLLHVGDTVSLKVDFYDTETGKEIGSKEVLFTVIGGQVLPRREAVA